MISPSAMREGRVMSSPGGRKGKIVAGHLAVGEEPVVSDQVETALRKLLSEEVVELTKRGGGGPKCWPAVLLGTAAGQSRDPDAPRHAVAGLIARILDVHSAVLEEYREEVARFCRTIATHTRRIGLGRLHHLRKTAKPYIEQVLGLSGEDAMRAATGHLIGRHLTIQQLISRLDPSQPFEIQARAVKVLPEIVNFELRNSLRAVEQRQKTLQTLDQAVGMVDRTKYFKSLTPKMRDACKSQMNGLKHRIMKAGNRR
jgi:hypothetical protein